jgi:hypothetical protein
MMNPKAPASCLMLFHPLAFDGNRTNDPVVTGALYLTVADIMPAGIEDPMWGRKQTVDY